MKVEKWDGERAQAELRSILNHVADELKIRHDFWLFAMDLESDSLPSLRPLWWPIFALAPEKLRADKTFVMKGIAKQPCVLEFASEKLKADKEVVRMAFVKAMAEGALAKGDDHVTLTRFFAKVAPELLSDRDFVLEAVVANGQVLGCVSEDFKRDEEVVMSAVMCLCTICYAGSSGSRPGLTAAFQFASESLRGDADFVLRLLEADKREKFWNADIIEDIAWAQTAILNYVTDDLRSNEKFWLEVMDKAKGQTHSDSFGDKAYWLRAIFVKPLPEKLRGDRDFVLEVVRRHGAWFILDEVAEDLRGDADFMLHVIEEHDKEARPEGFPYSDVPVKLRTDKEFMLTVIEKSAKPLTWKHSRPWPHMSPLQRRSRNRGRRRWRGGAGVGNKVPGPEVIQQHRHAIREKRVEKQLAGRDGTPYTLPPARLVRIWPDSQILISIGSVGFAPVIDPASYERDDRAVADAVSFRMIVKQNSDEPRGVESERGKRGATGGKKTLN
eukprot:g10377.t1